MSVCSEYDGREIQVGIEIRMILRNVRLIIRNLDIRTMINDKELEREMVEQSKELYEQKTLPGLYFSQNMGNMYTPSVYFSLFAFLTRYDFSFY